MKKIEFSKGINVANELTSWAHLDGGLFLGISNDKLLTDGDFDRLKSWGLDHVRVITDFTTIMELEAPHNWKEEGWQKVLETIQMAKDHEMGVVMDLHSTLGSEHIEGGSSGGVKNELLSNPEQQEIFYRIWHEFSKRLAGTEDYVAFEILNEITFDVGIGWNAVSQKAIEIVRNYSKDRRIILGGIWWNSIGGLCRLPIYDEDPNIIYTFHFYSPHCFTHQLIQQTFDNAIRSNMGGGLRLPYPGKYPHTLISGEESILPRKDGIPYVDKDVLKEVYFTELCNFRKKHPDLKIYCGEFGVNQYIHGASRLNWQRDVFDILKENKIKICYFMYKWPAWGIADPYNPSLYDKDVVEMIRAYPGF